MIQIFEPNFGLRFTNDCTVYIEGLPFDATEGQITSFFSSAGPVVSLRLPKWHDSGRLRGYGHVEFQSAEAANKALEMDGQSFRLIDLSPF
jgi:nucleolin